ncbi:MAG: hypothetical protein KA401_02070 [Anaerolineae bacterium]|nr:hypothetical protein [Anaerolineae bacterium]
MSSMIRPEIKTIWRSVSKSLIALGISLFLTLSLCLTTETVAQGGNIRVLAWNPDGTKIAIGGGPDTCGWVDSSLYDVQVIDTATELVVQTLTGFVCPVTSIDWSPDGSRIAASSLDGHGLRVWNSRTGGLISSLARGSQGVSSVKWNPDGESLAIGFMSDGASIVSPLTGETIGIPPIGGMNVDWSPAGDRLLIGSEFETSLFVSNINTHSLELELTGNELPVLDLAWSSDGSQIASAGIDSAVRIWNSVSGNLLFILNHSSEVAALAWHPNASRLASVGYDNLVKIWNTSTGLLVEQFQATGPVLDVDWNPDGTRLAYVDNGQTVVILEPSPITDVIPTNMPTQSQITPTALITAIEFSHDGSVIAVGYGADAENPCGVGYSDPSHFGAYLVDVQVSSQVQLLNECTVSDFAFSPTDTELAISTYIGREIIFDLQTQAPTLINDSQGIPYLAIGWANSGIYILESDRNILIRGVVPITEAMPWFYEFHNDVFTDVDISPDGARLVTSSNDGTAAIWAIADKHITLLYSDHTNSILSVDWSSVTSNIVTGDKDGHIRIWSSATGQTLLELESHTGAISALMWSPDGTRLASASEDGTVKVWNAQTGSLIETLTYPGPVYALDWSPDGTKIAYGGADLSGNPPEVVIIDAPEIEPTPTPTFTEPFDDAITPGEYITALDWDSDGSRLVFGTGQLLLPWPSEEGGAGGSRILVIERGGNLLYEVSVPYSTVAVEIDPTGETLLIFDVIPYLWDLQTGEMILRRNSEGLALQTGTWNPSTGSLLFTPVFGSLVYDAATWENLSYFADFLLPSGRFSEGQRMADSVWSPDGIHVASSTTFGPIYVWDSSNLEGVLEATFTGHSASIQDTVWSPDGTLIASGDVDGNVFVWNAQTGAVVTELDGHTDAILDMDWRPDGQQIITTSLDGTMRAWTWPSGAMNVVQSGTVVSAVAYSPDGMELAYGGLVPPGSLPEIVIVDAPQIEPTPTPTFTEPFDGAISTPEP